MKKLSVTFVALLGLGFSAVAHGQMHGMQRGNMMNFSVIRHHFVMQNGLEPQYAQQVNPLARTAENTEAGKQLFAQNCATCHGATGLGDGEAAKTLNPRPANIALFSKMPLASDGYLRWTITEGGTPVGSAMPPFKDALKANEIWKIVLYLREL